MTIQNKGQRRLSMFSFAALFLISVVLSCLAFTSSKQSKSAIYKEEIKQLRTELSAYQEKEKVLDQLSLLGQAIVEYDLQQRDNPTRTTKALAKCNTLSTELYQELERKDTVELYQNAKAITGMADQFMGAIQARSQDADGRIDQLRADLQTTEEKANNLQKDKTQLELQLLQKQTEVLKLQNELLIAQRKAAAAGGGGGAKAEEEPDCTIAINSYKGDVLEKVSNMPLHLQTIRDNLDDISGVLGIGKNKKTKEDIEKEIKAIEKALQALQKE